MTTKAIRLALCAAAMGAAGAKAEYVQLPAIQSTGAQYVQTDFKLASSDAVEVKYATGSTTSGNQNLFCNREAWNKNSFTLFANSGKTPRWDYDGVGTEKSGITTNTAYTAYVVNVDGNTGKWTVNGVEQTGKSQTPATFTPGGPLVFLASYGSGSSSAATFTGSPAYYASVTFCYAKIWGSDGTLKHHFVPAEDTDYTNEKERYGLLDIALATPKFYKNRGSAAFVPAANGAADVYGNAIRYDDGGNMTYWFWRGDKTAEDDSVSKADRTVAYSDGVCNTSGLAIVIR